MKNAKEIAVRASQLQASMPIGPACVAASREAGYTGTDVETMATLVATELDNHVLNAPLGQTRTLENLAKGQGKLARRARQLIRNGSDPKSDASF